MMLPLNWLQFYIFFRLPSGVIFNLLYLLTFFSSLGLWAKIMILLIISLQIVVLRDLYGRKLRGWRLNWLLLVAEFFLIPINFSNSFGSFCTKFLIYGLLYVWPNYIYFMKRKFLFYH